MVTWVGATLSVMLGILIYVAIPAVAMSMPAPVRQRVGTFYGKLAARLLKQWSFTRRMLSGYDVFPIDVDDEEKLLKVTLSSSMLGESNTYPFKDPDNRIKRLYNKPVAVNYEGIPAAVDAELAELGATYSEMVKEEGKVVVNESKREDEDDEVLVRSTWPVDDTLRLVDPVEAFSLVPNAVSPENVKTARKKTKQRFEKYRDRVGAVQMMTGALGFAMGLGGILVMWYAQTNFIDGSSTDPELPSSPLYLADVATQLVVSVL